MNDVHVHVHVIGLVGEMGGSYGDPSEKNLTILLKWKENQEETLTTLGLF